VHERIDPLVHELAGPLAFQLHVGLPENTDPLWERDLDNYLYPIARTLPERVVSVRGTKGRGGPSTVRLEAAVPAVELMIGFDVARSAPDEATWKRAVHGAVKPATELPEGPVALELAFTVGPAVNWPGIWKASIDGLSPLLGRTYPDREWNPLDGRIVRLGLHKTVDASYGREASMTVLGTVADERWPELAWLAALGPDERSAFVQQHRAKQRNQAARRRALSTEKPRRMSTRAARNIEIDSENLLIFRDDDPGYLAWTAANPSGFVLNISCGRSTRARQGSIAPAAARSSANPPMARSGRVRTSSSALLSCGTSTIGRPRGSGRRSRVAGHASRPWRSPATFRQRGQRLCNTRARAVRRHSKAWLPSAAGSSELRSYSSPRHRLGALLLGRRLRRPPAPTATSGMPRTRSQKT
jgi:hypothetical protein